VELEREGVACGSGAAAVPAYSAHPARAAGPLPVVIVIHEVWGLDEHIRDLVHRFAAAGYLAMAPDLYAHGGTTPAPLTASRIEAAKRFLEALPGAVWRDPAARDAAVAARPNPERDALGETIGMLLTPDRPYARYLADLRTVFGTARSRAGSTGRVASVGYCMGGHLSALLAGAEPDLAAAAIYYGASPTADRMSELAAPLIGFYGADDPRITGGVEAFAAMLEDAGRPFEYHVYPDTPHAFFNDTRPSYRVNAARDAWARTLAFFAEQAGDA
jgi:carboxymethylenebutenolidase